LVVSCSIFPTVNMSLPPAGQVGVGHDIQHRLQCSQRQPPARAAQLEAIMQAVYRSLDKTPPAYAPTAAGGTCKTPNKTLENYPQSAHTSLLSEVSALSLDSEI
jgi:hypothetical protein